ncbi:MAG: 4Fe-4S binding protein [Planctomycetaceae bacterium]|nr:4Fe-4S binding protein [Planctomycetaceae bacterium]
MRRPLWVPWRWWRRAAQLALLLLFLWLFRRTEYIPPLDPAAVADQLAGGENVFFRLDPLAGAAAMLAARQVIAAFWPALIVVLLTLVVGRFFCGWVCPLGTMLDVFHRLLRPITCRTNRLLASRADRPAAPEATATSDVGCCIQACRGHGTPSHATTAHPASSALRSTRYALLTTILVAALFAFPLVGFLDPFSILVRGLACWADPLLCQWGKSGLAWLGDHWNAGWMADWADRRHLLPFRPMVFQLAWFSGLLLAAIFILELVARRFWCRYLCPAGAMFGLLSTRPLLRRIPVTACPACGDCSSSCRMDAIPAGSGFSPADCNLCMDCVSRCPRGIVRFTWKRSKRFSPRLPAEGPGARATRAISPRPLGERPEVRTPATRSCSPHPNPLPKGEGTSTAFAKGRGTKSRLRGVTPTNLSRRSALAGIALGVGIPGIAAAVRAVHPVTVDPCLLRPPGAADERTFLSLCIRCGECLKVCPTNILQPAVLEAGVEGVFSPRLIPRLVMEQTNCEFTCTLCGQVCPTGAIPHLTEEQKHQHPTGKAYFDHARCLPWAKHEPCVRCEEMCPAADKAIKIGGTLTVKNKDGQPFEVQLPRINRDLCVGCGICESNCPLDGPAGIRVRRVDAPDPGTEFLLKGE